MVTPVELAELHVAHEILGSAYEHLSWVRGNKQERLANVDAMIILLDSRAMVQQGLMDSLFSQGDGCR